MTPRLTALVALGATLALATAACEEPQDALPIGRVMHKIQGGTVDQGDQNVVVILINSSQGMSLCTGSLIAPNLVLTAHHCVADVGSVSSCGNAFGSSYSTSSFRVTTSYNAAANIFNGSGSWPSADGVNWFAVNQVATPGSNICGDDLAALRLSAPISSVCPLIPRVDTQLSDGEAYTAVGFGITSPNGQVAGTRYKVSGMSVICVSDCNDPSQSSTLEWLGGANSSKGTCEGDSGGPAIDSSGRVTGSVSRGPQGSCNQTVYESYYGQATWIKQQASAAATAGGYTAAGWVNGGATNNPANGYCGTTTDGGVPQSDAGTTQHDAGTVQQDSGTAQHDAGTVQHDAGTPQQDAATGCGGGPACSAGYQCVGGQCVAAGGCGSGPACAAGTTCVNGVCVPSLGGCGSGPACQAGYTCVSGACVPSMGGGGTAATGESCTNNSDCVSGLCVNGDTANGYCTQTCSAADSCPNNALCLTISGQQLCGPTNSASGNGGSTSTTGGCQAGGGQPLGSLGLLLLALGLVLRKRG